MQDTKITTLPATLKDDAIGFFEAIKLSDLEDKWLRLSASVQRRFFGRVPFGRKAVKVKPDGQVWTYQTAGFGHDWDEQRYFFNHVAGKFFYVSSGTEARI